MMVVLGSLACSDDVGRGSLDEKANNNIQIEPINNGIPKPDVGHTDATAQDALSTDTGDPELPNIDTCQADQVLGCVDGSSQLVCNAAGTGVLARTCAGGQHCLAGECGAQLCHPQSQECLDSQNTQRCNAEGTGWVDVTACTEDTVCERNACRTICDLGGKVGSYFGCEYWSVYLDQYDDPTTGASAREIPHAVVISNPNNVPVTVVFQSNHIGATFNIADPVVPAGQSKAFTMPRMVLDGTGTSNKSIFIRSSMPVTAHQFNPFNNQRLYSNDASLLLPVSSLGKVYYAMSWPTQALPSLPGLPAIADQMAFVTIVASAQGLTNVVVNSTAQIVAGPNMSGFPPGVGRNFQLSYGQVLNLKASTGRVGATGNDLTGTFIAADQPIAVFAGHEQAVISYDSTRDSCCADHLEQQLYPLDSWGSHYIAAFSPGRTNTKDHWRIMAGEDNVTITTNPPQPGAHQVTLNAGKFVSFFSDQNFEVKASGKVLVGQFLASQQQTEEFIGDPAFVLAVPVERFRKDYHVLTPSGYSKDYVSIIRPSGVAVTLDGVALDNAHFVALGGGDFEVASVLVTAGLHVMAADAPFSVTAYGMDNAVSYAYPGGLNFVGAEAQ